MTEYRIQLSQYVEETCEIIIDTDSKKAAIAIANQHITQGTIGDAFDLDWSDGNGTHEDGISIDLVEECT